MAESLDRDAIDRHIALLHDLARAAGAAGKLVLFSVTEDPAKQRKGTAQALHFGIGDVEAMTDTAFAYAQRDHTNVYAPWAIFRSDLERGKKGEEQHVVATLGFVIDYDNDKFKLGDLPLEAPYVVETSAGNLQPIYPLTRALANGEAKQLATALSDCVGADPGTKDLSHVWRIPGTRNWPTKKKLARGRPTEPQPVRVAKSFSGDLVEPETLAEAVAGKAKPGGKTNGKTTGAKNRTLAALLEHCGAELRNMLRAEPAPGEDRSRTAWRIIRRLVRKDFSDPEIRMLIEAHPQGAGARYAAGKDLAADILRIRDKLATGGSGNSMPAPWLAACATQHGIPLGDLANARIALRLDPALKDAFSYDQMQCLPLLTQPSEDVRPLKDVDVVAVQEYLQTCGLRKVSTETVHKAVMMAADERAFHPVRDYLDALVWDSTPRVERWLTTYLGAEATPYTAAVGKMFLIAMVARIYRPGCQADYMPVLEGEQGALKTSACKVLAGEWFSDQLPDVATAGKDVSQHLRGKWLIEISEMHAMSRTETAQLKAFITRTVERYRPSYGRHEVIEPRQCVFAGTTNKSTYLRDETGGRRFWPLVCGTIDLEALKRDRDQLFAETVHLFHAGAHWWPSRAFEREHILAEQEDRFEVDVWEEKILDYLRSKQASSDPKTTVWQIAREALFFEATARIGTSDGRRITAVLERHWERKRMGKGRDCKRYWVPPGCT
jgi:hypothetical protein